MLCIKDEVIKTVELIVVSLSKGSAQALLISRRIWFSSLAYRESLSTVNGVELGMERRRWEVESVKEKRSILLLFAKKEENFFKW